MTQDRCCELDVEREANPSEAAQSNKWLAIWRYAHGYASERSTVDAFASHPEWKHA